MKKCPNCNKLVHDEATVCRFCGHEVPSQDRHETRTEIGTSGESQRSRYPEDTFLRLILGGCSSMLVVLLIFFIMTVYIFTMVDVYDAGQGFALGVIPAFFICTIVAFAPGALGGVLGAHIGLWLADRYHRIIDPRISAIIGGALGVLVPVLVFVLFMYILDVLGFNII